MSGIQEVKKSFVFTHVTSDWDKQRLSRILLVGKWH